MKLIQKDSKAGSKLKKDDDFTKEKRNHRFRPGTVALREIKKY